MALNDSNTTNNTNGQKNGQQTTQNNNPTRSGNGGAAEPKTWSFHKPSLFGRAPIGRGVGSESLAVLQEALSETFKKATDPDIEITLLPIDNTNDPGLAFSVLIVAIRFKSQPHAVAYHSLIIEATGAEIPAKFEQGSNGPIEVFRVAGDSTDPIFLQKTFLKMQSAFPQAKLFYVDSCVVPRLFDPKDKVAVHKLSLNAALACTTELEIRQKNFQDMNLAFAENDSSLSVRLKFEKQQFENAVGEPIRSDLVVSFTSQQQRTQQDNESIHTGDRVSNVSEISGFIDLVWAPVAQANFGYNAYSQNQPQNMQKYVSRLVITDMQSPYAATLPAQLLSLITSLSVRDDNNWIQTYLPIPNTDGSIDIHDIGGIGIEANFENNPTGYGTRVNTSRDNFRPENLSQLVGALIQPGLIISLDVPDCGPSTWNFSIFQAASNGVKEAKEAIRNAADQLTNNNFSRYFPVGSEMFTDTNNRIHNGYYTGKDGTKHDLRDIDYLAVTNIIGERDPVAIRDFSDTFTRTQFPLNQRLAARKKMIMSMTGQTAVFTGFSTRVTFTNQMLDALSKAAKDAGLSVSIYTPMNTNEFNNERGVAGFVNSAILQPGQGSIFGRNTGNNNNNGGGFFSNSPRWGSGR